jgi:hypothetical protein
MVVVAAGEPGGGAACCVCCANVGAERTSVSANAKDRAVLIAIPPFKRRMNMCRPKEDELDMDQQLA